MRCEGLQGKRSRVRSMNGNTARDLNVKFKVSA